MSITDHVEEPPIVRVREESAGSRIEFDLSQGVPFFGPPREAISKALSSPAISRYSPDQGHPEFIKAAVGKLRRENGIRAGENEVMATPGSNYAFFIALSSVVNRGEKVALLAPYYFNHLMALQILGMEPHLIPPSPDFRLNVEGVRRAIKEGVKAVVLVNPSNPSGVNLRKDEVKHLLEEVEDGGIWLISDEAYEHFVYNTTHTSPAAIFPHTVISLFSMSKSFGVGGWRVGYMHYPEELRGGLLKAQDTIGICAPTPSQHLGTILLNFYSPSYPNSHKAALLASMKLFKDVLEDLNVEHTGGEGALYLFFRFPTGGSGWEASRLLARKWGILTVPGEPFGAGGWVRLSFGNITGEAAERAAERLREALKRTA